jgi:hypothetical protein
MSTQICKFCSKDFIYPSKLKKHQQTTQCRNSDETQISSQNDQTLLTKNKLYICSSCEYSTKFSYNLNRHTKTCMSKVTKSDTNVKDFSTSETNGNELVTRLMQENQQLKDMMTNQIKMCVKDEIKELKDELKDSKTIINDTSTTYNNNNTTNNLNLNLTINNNNTIDPSAITQPGYKYINPVGCEDLSFITEEQLNYIYENTDNSTAKLLEIIYSKRENRNFTKDNVNKPDMKYYSKKLQVDYIQEYDFIEQLTQQRILNFHLRLIHTFKHKLSFEKFTNYFRRIITIERIFNDFDIDALKTKTHSSAIKSVINQLSRDKRITRDICEFFKLVEENELIKAETEARIKLYQEIESTALIDYEKREKLPMDLLTTQRNLHHFKKLFINQAMLEQQTMYDRKACN